MIHCGVLAFFRDRFRRLLDYVWSVRGYDPARLARAAPRRPIYLSGGGKFGDIWPHFQQFRLRVLADNPGRPIVQLPQMIRFNGIAMLMETREAIRRRGKFRMLVRDEPSLDFARESSNATRSSAPTWRSASGPCSAAASRPTTTRISCGRTRRPPRAAASSAPRTG
jgi:pyruvyl transferase EpsO